MKGHISSAFSRLQNIVVAIIFFALAGCGGGGGSSKASSSVANSSLINSSSPSVVISSSMNSSSSSVVSSSSMNSSSSSVVSSSSMSSNMTSAISLSSLASSSSSFSLPTKISVSGTLQGNTGDVTLSLNGQQQSFTGESFTFTQKINQGERYAVVFVLESTGMACTVAYGNGVAQSNVTAIAVSCAAKRSILRFDALEVLGDLTTGDFNGDSHVDLALTTRTMPDHPAGDSFYLTKFLLGNGAGNFLIEQDVETIRLGVTNQRGRQSAAADFNGDGFDDYVLYDEVYLGNAAGIPTRSFVAASHPGTMFFAEDFNGDTLPDILGNIQAASLGTYFGLQISNANGTFAPMVDFATRTQVGINWIYGMGNYTLADVNGDGKRDIVVLGGAIEDIKNLFLKILLGRGDGTFDVVSGVTDLPNDLELDDNLLWDYAKEITSGDFDGDGDIDLAITSDTSFLQIMSNDSAGNFTLGQRVLVGTQPIHIGAADFNLDGKLDLVSANAKSNTIHVSYGIGNGTFGDKTGAPESWVSVKLASDVELFDMVIADFDGDGAPDIAVAEDGTNPSDSGRGSVQIVFASGL